MNWRDAQNQFFDFRTSLGPYTVDGLFEFLDGEYPDGLSARDHVEAFIASDAEPMRGGADRASMPGPGWPAPPARD